MKNLTFEAQTQAFSTWGDKLLQHTDVLANIQNERHFRPITVQLAPTEFCDSDCPFCSVQNRPTNKKIAWENIEKGLREFKKLGAKSVEITGGGNPLMYRDGTKKVADVVRLANELGYKIGVITNSENLPRHLADVSSMIQWVRVSLIKLEEGKNPEDYRFDGFDGKLAFSYITHAGTTAESFRKMGKLASLWPDLKFVRIAADCLTEDSLTIKEKWGSVLEEVDPTGKFFIKEIGANFHAHEGGCWMGMLRPYWVHDGVYICTSHVLKHRVYHPTWKLCGQGEIEETWNRMNRRFAEGLPPYDIDIKGECWHCYYANNNRILDAVINELPDKDFA